MKTTKTLFIYIAYFTLATTLFSCSPIRKPVPVGTVPTQSGVPAEDEEYGHQVLNQLLKQFALDTDDTRINRVRDIVDRLTSSSKNDHNPWHVHILVGDKIKNAAATRGNFVFVWTGMLYEVQNDDELATILAHEIGHVLAGHTQPDPSEEAARIISGIAGMAAGIATSQRGGFGPLADIAESVVKATFEAALVNPASQTNELEADMIGLFLMADAGYDPEKAVKFWERVKSDPDFQQKSLQFFSSHPSNEERVLALKKHLPEAINRYLSSSAINIAGNNSDRSNSQNKKRSNINKSFSSEIWKAEIRSDIFSSADPSSRVIGVVNKGEEISLSNKSGRWLKIKKPIEGYVRGRDFSPINN